MVLAERFLFVSFFFSFLEIANFNFSRDTINVGEKKCRKRRKEIFCFLFQFSRRNFGHINLFSNSRLKMTRHFHHFKRAAFFFLVDYERNGCNNFLF